MSAQNTHPEPATAAPTAPTPPAAPTSPTPPADCTDPTAPTGPAAPDQVALAERLRALHVPGDPLVLVNVWDVLGARVVEAAGARAIATASWAMSASLGLPDGEGMVLTDNLAVVGRIARAVAVPVTADFERGYGATPENVACAVARLLATGAVGANIEDSLVELGRTAPDGVDPLRPVDDQCARLAAARGAGERMGVPLVLNARTDAHARGVALPDVVARGRAYLDAGADCVFVVGRTSLRDVAVLAEAFDGRLNVLGRPGQPSIAELTTAGVARISIGSSGPGVAFAALARAAGQLLTRGDYLEDQAFAFPE